MQSTATWWAHTPPSSQSPKRNNSLPRSSFLQWVRTRNPSIGSCPKYPAATAHSLVEAPSHCQPCPATCCKSSLCHRDFSSENWARFGPKTRGNMSGKNLLQQQRQALQNFLLPLWMALRLDLATIIYSSGNNVSLLENGALERMTSLISKVKSEIKSVLFMCVILPLSQKSDVKTFGTNFCWSYCEKHTFKRVQILYHQRINEEFCMCSLQPK